MLTDRPFADKNIQALLFGCVIQSYFMKYLQGVPNDHAYTTHLGTEASPILRPALESCVSLAGYDVCGRGSRHGTSLLRLQDH